MVKRERLPNMPKHWVERYKKGPKAGQFKNVVSIKRSLAQDKARTAKKKGHGPRADPHPRKQKPQKRKKKRKRKSLTTETMPKVFKK